MGFLYLGNDPVPEFYGYHFGHVAAKSVDAFLGPVLEYVVHFVPCVGDWVEVACVSVGVVYSVIEFDGFVPVGDAYPGVKFVVACGSGRVFVVGFVPACVEVEVAAKLFAGEVIVVVLGGEWYVCIIVLSEVFDALGRGIGVVFAGEVVGDEVDYHLEACVVGAFDELFEFC